MSTLNDKIILKKGMISYLSFSLFLLIFQFVYHFFAHGVTSPYMTYAFLIPLVLGISRKLLNYFLVIKEPFSDSFWQMGIVTLSVWSILHGVFDIYGSSNELVFIFLMISILCFALSILFMFLLRKKVTE